MAGSSQGAQSYTPPSIAKFFVFNPKYGPREDNEHEKILFYHPAETPLAEQSQDVGLSEALTNITRTFAKGLPCEVMHTKKTRWILNNPEPGYWMVMILNNATITKTAEDVDYEENELNDLALAFMLRKSYDHFRLFYGPFDRIVELKKDVKYLRDILLKSFPSKILPNLNLSQANIFGVLSGMSFLPCPPIPFMRIQSIASSVTMTLPNVHHVVLMFRDLLMWSDLDQDETRIIVQYFVDTLWKKLQAQIDTRFVFGMEDLNNPQSRIVCPDLFIGPDAKRHSLVILHGFGITGIFLTDPSAVSSHQFFKNLYDIVAPPLRDYSLIMSKVAEGTESDEFQYIYFNSMNLAIKSTVKNRGLDLTRETMSVLLEMHETFTRGGDYQGEEMVKTSSGNWIIGKKSESRELYVLCDQKKKTMLEVADDLKLILAKAFRDIFPE